jgi:hypothetical protein
VAAQTPSRHFASRASDRRAAWESTRGSFPEQWRDASFVFDTLTYLTADELESIGAEFIAIIDRYAERVADRSKRPDDALPVAVVAHGHPLPPHQSGN